MNISDRRFALQTGIFGRENRSINDEKKKNHEENRHSNNLLGKNFSQRLTK